MTHSHPPAELDVWRAARIFGRALRLRCPNCGGRGIFRTLFELRPDCPNCGLEMDRGEDDYFLGTYTVNLVVVELLFAAIFTLIVILTWPDPPWALLQYGGAALMLVGAVACYPFAKVGWLAFDMVLRPVSRDELPGALQPPLAAALRTEVRHK